MTCSGRRRLMYICGSDSNRPGRTSGSCSGKLRYGGGISILCFERLKLLGGGHKFSFFWRLKSFVFCFLSSPLCPYVSSAFSHFISIWQIFCTVRRTLIVMLALTHCTAHHCFPYHTPYVGSHPLYSSSRTRPRARWTASWSRLDTCWRYGWLLILLGVRDQIRVEGTVG